MKSLSIKRASSALLAIVLAAVPALAAPSAAAEPAAQPGTAYSADPLPTTQINGVVWDQLVVGDVVYVTGQFTAARPAGAALGQNETPRANILAYRLSTGELIDDFAPTLNGPGRALAVSDDGRTLYVGGAFNQVNGAWRNALAALDISDGSGTLIKSFQPVFNTTVNAIDVVGDVVYAGGAFSKVNGLPRLRLAAVNAVSGSLLEWTASATGPNAQVYAVRVSPDGSKVAVGGSFSALNGRSRPGYGLALMDASSGRVLPTPVNSYVRNGGTRAAILDIEVDDTGFYGTGYSQHSREGNLEGTFRADWNGQMLWVEPCHGDSYSLYATESEVYVASHAHSCETIGGFPDMPSMDGAGKGVNYNYGTAFTNTPDVTISTKGQGGYHNWSKHRSPQLLSWYPHFFPGEFTRQYQAAWDVTATDDYLLFAGEFITVDGKAQQGLVRFPRRGTTKGSAPVGTGRSLDLKLASHSDNTVTADFAATWDRDDQTLTYSLYRDGGAEPVASTDLSRTFWELGRATLEDPQAPGGPHTYTLVVSDPAGNTVSTEPVPVEVRGEVEEPAPPAQGTVLASDSFDRTGSWGWGQADTGGAWTVSSRSRFSVADSRGLIKLDRAGWTTTAGLESVSSASTRVTTAFTLSEMPTGKGVYTAVQLRSTAAGSYGVKIVTSPSGAVTAHLVAHTGAGEVFLGTAAVPGTWEPGTEIHVDGSAVGTGATALEARVWLGDAEDQAVSLNAEDSTDGLQEPGKVGVQVYVSASATSTTQVLSFADFKAVAGS